MTLTAMAGDHARARHGEVAAQVSAARGPRGVARRLLGRPRPAAGPPPAPVARATADPPPARG